MNNMIIKTVKIMGIVICFALFGGSEGMNFPPERASECTTLPLRSTLDGLIEKHRARLPQSKVYIAVTVHNQIPFIPNLKETLEANVAELDRHGVQSHVIITCDGIKEDFNECNKQFSDFPLPLEKREILFNKKNVGLSFARWNQFNYIHELMKEDEKNNLSPYFFVFDGDDIIHKDLLLIELLALLETGADAVSPGDYFGMYDVKETASSGNILRCRPEDSQEILERASGNVGECLITEAGHFEEFAFNLFDGKVLEKVLSKGYKFGLGDYEKQIEPEQDFVTLEPFKNALTKTKIINVFLPDIPKEAKYRRTGEGCGPLVAPFFDKQNRQNTLFYYMRHDNSMQMSMEEMKESGTL